IVEVGPIRIHSLATHGGVAIEVGAIGRSVTADNVSIDVDIAEAVVDVDIPVHIHKRPVNADPPTAVPTVVVDPSSVIVPVIVQPGANSQSHSERDCRGSDYGAG